MLISVLICTRGRPRKLKNALAALMAQELPLTCDFEVLIVSNGPKHENATDDRVQLGENAHGRIRWCYRDLCGKSRSANSGVLDARGDIVAFLDDDVLPRKDWLKHICDSFHADTNLGAICGRVELYNPADLPTGVRTQIQRVVFASPADSFDLFIGCNFAVKRVLIEEFGLYDPDMGPGLRIGSGEDTDLSYRLWRAGVKIVYDPDLFVLHDHGRHSSIERQSIERCYAAARGAVYAKHVLRGDRLLTRTLYHELAPAWKRAFGRDDGPPTRHSLWLVSGFFRYCLIRTCRVLRLSRLAEALAAARS